MNIQAVIFGSTCLLLACSNIAFSQSLNDSGVNSEELATFKQSEEEALEQDLALVAKAKGWSIAEAAADRKAADAVGAVAEKLAALRPDQFVGAALSPEPGGAPVLYVKGFADQMVYDLVNSSDIYINVVDNQPYSFAELEKIKRQVHSALSDEGYKYIITSFDIRDAGKINALVTGRPGLAERVDDIKMLFPESVRDNINLIISDKIVAEDHDAYGGMLAKDDGTSECTTGWSVENAAGTTGVTTAGHCDGINEIEEPGVGDHTAVHQNQHRGEWGDIEWKTTNTPEPAEFYASATATRLVTSVEARANIVVGESICVYGRFSNSRDCSLDVSATSVSCTVSGVFNDRLVRMNGDVTIGGDSGGGWSWGNRAYGSHKGSCGGGNVFSVADLYDEAIDVSVRVQ